MVAETSNTANPADVMDMKRHTGRLFKLPPELRNQLYELIYAHDTEDSGNIDLLTAKRPNKELLLTCRAIYQEARSVYREGYQAYWKLNSFTLEDHEFKLRKGSLDHIDIADLDHIQSCRALFRDPTAWSGDPTYYTYRGENLWHVEEHGHGLNSPATSQGDLRIFVRPSKGQCTIFRDAKTVIGPPDSHPASVGEALVSMVSTYGARYG